MRIQHAHRLIVTKALRSWRHVAGLSALLFNLSRFNTDFRSVRSVVITAVRVFLILLVILLLVCTEIDVLRQSFESGQFWNAIIVIVCTAIIVVWTMMVCLVRRVEVARWVRTIPRQRQIGSEDVTQKMMDRIEAKRLECKELFKKQMDFSRVEHPGLRNPLNVADGTGGSDVPYWELADTIPKLLESNVTMTVPQLTIPVGCTLREYLLLAIQERALEVREDNSAVVERFIDLYEQLRYSSRSMTWAMLTEMMDALIKVGYMILDSRGYPQQQQQQHPTGQPTMQWYAQHLPASLAQHLQQQEALSVAEKEEEEREKEWEAMDTDEDIEFPDDISRRSSRSRVDVNSKPSTPQDSASERSVLVFGSESGSEHVSA